MSFRHPNQNRSHWVPFLKRREMRLPLHLQILALHFSAEKYAGIPDVPSLDIRKL